MIHAAARGMRSGTFALGLAGVPLAWQIGLRSQTELPKGLMAFSFGVAAVLLALVLPGAACRLGSASRGVLGLFALWLLWAGAAAGFALVPAATPAAFFAIFVASLWLWSGAQVGLQKRWGLLALLSLAFSATLAALVGLVQDSLIAGTRFPFNSYVGELSFDLLRRAFEALGMAAVAQTDPPGSLFGHTNVAAEFVAVGAAVLLSLALGAPKGRRRAMWFTAISLPLAIQLLFIARSGSRGALLSLAAGVAALFFICLVRGWWLATSFRERARFIALRGALILGAGALAALALGGIEVQPRHGQNPVPLSERLASSWDQSNTTVRERLDLWANTLAMIEDRPIFGVGPGGFRSAYPDWANARRQHEDGRFGLARQPEKPHNEYLRFAAETGWPGLGIFLLAIGFALWLSARRAARNGDVVALASGAGLVVILAAGVVGFTILQTGTVLAFAALTGLILGRESAASPTTPTLWTPRNRMAALVIVLVLSGLAAVEMRARWQASRDLGALRDGGDFGILGDSTSAQRTRLLRRLRLVDAAIARRPRDDRALLLRADTLSGLGRYEESKGAATEALRVHPRLANAYLQRAEAALSAGDIESSLRDAESAFDLQPRDPAVQLLVARLRARTGDPAEARARLQVALGMQPRGPIRLRILLEASILAAEARDLSLATRYLVEAERLAPNQSVTHVARAVLMQTQAPGAVSTIDAWQKVLDSNPRHPEALTRLGQAAMIAGRPAEAVELFDRAFAVAPAQSSLLFQRARALRRAGRPEEALRSALACMKRVGKIGGDMALWSQAMTLARAIEKELRQRDGEGR